MKPSFLSSTLSLAFLFSIFSIFLLVITAILVAVFAPEAYKVISDEKTAFLIVSSLYCSFVAQILGAYLSARAPNTKED